MRYAVAGLLFVAVLAASRLFLYPRFGVPTWYVALPVAIAGSLLALRRSRAVRSSGTALPAPIPGPALGHQDLSADSTPPVVARRQPTEPLETAEPVAGTPAALFREFLIAHRAEIDEPDMNRQLLFGDGAGWGLELIGQLRNIVDSGFSEPAIQRALSSANPRIRQKVEEFLAFSGHKRS